MKKKKIIKQLNIEFNALPVPDVLKKVQENSKIVVKQKLKRLSPERRAKLFSPMAFAKFGALALVVIALVVSPLFSVVGNVTNQPAYSNLTIVTVDINPSLELTIDEDDNIVNARAINSDGIGLLSGLTLAGQKFENAINNILDKATEQGYINANLHNAYANAVMFTVKNDNDNKAKNRHKQEMQNTLNSYLTTNNIDCNVVYEELEDEFEDEYERFKESLEFENQMSEAKYNYIRKILEQFPALRGHEHKLAEMPAIELYKLLNNYATYVIDKELLDDLFDGVVGNLDEQTVFPYGDYDTGTNDDTTDDGDNSDEEDNGTTIGDIIDGIFN